MPAGHEKEIHILGGASGKTYIVSVPVDSSPLGPSLMELLQEKNIPVASTCIGEGVCHQCTLILNGDEILSCQLFGPKLFKLLQSAEKIDIIISYL